MPLDAHHGPQGVGAESFCWDGGALRPQSCVAKARRGLGHKDLAHLPSRVLSQPLSSSHHSRPHPICVKLCHQKKTRLGKLPGQLLTTILLDILMANDDESGNILAPRPSLLPPLGLATDGDGALPHATPFASPMGDDELFDLFIDDNALLSGPSFLAPLATEHDNGDTPHSCVPPASFVDDNALLGAQHMDVNAPQGFAMTAIDGDSLLLYPPLDDWHYVETSQPPTDDATTVVLIPPWPTSAQGFQPCLPEAHCSQPEDVRCLPSDDLCCVEDFGGPLGLPSQTFGHFDLPEPVNAAHPAPTVPAARQPLEPLDSPQPPTQDEAINQDAISRTSKRRRHQVQSSRRPEKRLCPIRPKPLPVPPSPEGDTPETTRSPPPKLDDRKETVPTNMLTTFKVEGLAVTGSAGRRTRARNVCLKCQTLRKKVSLDLDAYWVPKWLGIELADGRGLVRWHVPLSALPRLWEGTRTRCQMS